MINIFDELYNGNINEFSRSKISKNEYDKYKQDEAFEKLKETLSKEQMILLDDYLKKQALEDSDMIKNSYIQGIKTGMLMGIEISNIELE